MLDETKGTPGTPKEDDSKDAPKGTPKEKGKIFTVAEIDKIKSDAAAMGQGREKKVADQEKEVLNQELQSTKSRLDALEREANESHLAEARAGGSETLSAYQREQATAKREKDAADKDRDLARREEQLKVDREAVDKESSAVSIANLAKKHGLETETLESLGISDPEVLERVAEKLAGVKPVKTELGEGEEIPSGEAPELTPDTGEGSGSGGGPLTAENVEGSSIAAVDKALGKAPDK